MADMRHVAHSEPLDLAGLLDDIELNEWLEQQLTKIVQQRFEESPPYLTLVDWGDSDGLGGPPPEDPTTLSFTLPLTEDCYYQCTLTELVQEVIDDHISGKSRKIESEDAIRVCRTMAAHLRVLADRLDAACLEDKP